MDLLILHLVLIVWLSVGASSRWTDHPSDRMLAAGGLGWANLVITAWVLSPFGRLNDPSWFLAVSIGLALLTALAAWCFPSPPASGSESPSAHYGLTLAAILTVAPVALAIALAAVSYFPADPAALGRSLPCTLAQLDAGSLLRFPAHATGELLFPFNYGLLQAWVLVFQSSLQPLSYINPIAWLSAGFAVHRLALTAGSTANAALVAGWCALMTTPVLAQATSTGPILVTGVALVAAASFALDWVKRARRSSAAFAGLLAGLAGGTSPGALLLILGLIAFGLTRRPRRPAAADWKVVLPGLALGVLPSLLVLASLLADDRANAWQQAFDAMPPSASQLGAALLVPLSRTPEPLLAPTESTVGLGWAGLLCIAALAHGLVRIRLRESPFGWLGLLSAAWLMACIVASFRLEIGSDALVPALLLAAAGVAHLVDRLVRRPRTWILCGACLILGALWSAQLYLRHNAYRPLAPLLDATLAERQFSLLPPLLEQRLRDESLLHFTNRDDERLLKALSGRPERSRKDAANGGRDAVYTVISRVPADPDCGGGTGTGDNTPAYALIACPGKVTAGVEYLGQVSLGAMRRDYFGLLPQAAAGSARSNVAAAILVTAWPVPSTVQTSQVRLEVTGLLATDALHLEIAAEQPDGRRELLAVFPAQASRTVSRPGWAHRLGWRLVNPSDGRVVDTGHLDGPSNLAEPSQSRLAPDPAVGFELVAKASQPAVSRTGLSPAEGPFPQWNLPLICWARDESVTLSFKVAPGVSTLRLSFSARLYMRRRAALEVIGNGAPIGRFEFDDPVTWQEPTVTFRAVPGTNVIELRDVPLPPEPDWADYLERYPDVKRHIERMRQPPQVGAREHYELSGRSEGRTLQMVQPARPAAGSYYYLFRRLRVEGLTP